MTTEQPTLQEDMKIEEIDDDEIPELEDAPQKGQTTEQKTGQTSRTEKKSRKAMQKLGLEPFEGVTSVQIKQSSILFTIDKPEVYKMAHGDTFVIIGQAQVRDITKGLPGMNGGGDFQQQLQMLQQLKQMGALKGENTTEGGDVDDDIPPLEETKPTESSKTTETKPTTEKVEKKPEPKKEEPKKEAPVAQDSADESGVDAKDIELVQAQVSDASRAQIVAALKKNGNDVVNTIMELSGL